MDAGLTMIRRPARDKYFCRNGRKSRFFADAGPFGVIYVGAQGNSISPDSPEVNTLRHGDYRQETHDAIRGNQPLRRQIHNEARAGEGVFRRVGQSGSE